MQIETLWNTLSKHLPVDEIMNGDNPNFIIRPPIGSVKVCVGDYGSGIDDDFKRTKADTFSSVVVLSRHFVTKPIYTIEVSHICKDNTYTLKTTADHTCAIKNRVLWDEMCKKIENHEVFTEEDFDKFSNKNIIQFISARDIKVGDIMPFHEEPIDMLDTNEFSSDTAIDKIPFKYYCCDGNATVTSVSCDDNVDGCWVYDLEVESGRHVYYANNILVHNSQFINLAPITKMKCREHGISENTTFADLPEAVRQSVIDDTYHILDLVNANVEQLINNGCHTTQGNVLRYALEYIAAEGFYFKKKHYIVHKILDEGKPTNKFKYSGISVKKSEIPEKMKTFLKDVYESTMTTNDWSEKHYSKAVLDAYNNFKSLDWNDLAFYKKLRTAKDAISTFESEKGAGAHARAANIYNGLLRHLGLGGKYPEIGQGDEMRYAYIRPTNIYGIDVIGFKERIPDEFRSMFTVDYEKMFKIIFTNSLENYVSIMNYTTENPSKQTEDPSFDIF
jgi:hypothetical protein